MDISEIRDAFRLGESLTTRIRDFRLDRLNKLARRDISFNLHNAPLIVLHIIPLAAFQNPYAIDIARVADDWHRIPQIYGLPSGYRINLDGLVIYTDLRDGTVGAYTQIFRSGMVEATNAYLLEPEGDGRKRIPLTLEAEIIEACNGLLKYLQSLAIDPPLYVFLTLIGVNGYTIVNLHNRSPYKVNLGHDM
jgi:hypothetical protein